jgi:hypothetical protein
MMMKRTMMMIAITWLGGIVGVVWWVCGECLREALVVVGDW